MFCFKTILCGVSLILLASFSISAQAQDAQTWTQFRGAEGTGIAPSTSTPPTQWTSDNYKWNTPLPGKGWSSPVYADGKIWLTSAVTEAATPEQIAKALEGKEFPSIKTAAASIEMHALCVDLQNGKLIHDIKLAKIDSPEPINPMNSYASPTCAISKGRVVCHFGNYGTWCLDASSGKEHWNKKYVVDHSVGPGSSPVIFGDNVVLVCDGCDEQYIAAVNLESGDEVWKTNRPEIKAPSVEMMKAYSTPTMITVDDKQQMVVPGAQWICAYDPTDGKELWRFNHGRGFSITPMAAYVKGLVIFSNSYGGSEFIAVRPEGTGDISKTAQAWRAKNAPAMASFIVNDDHVFAVSDKGVCVCLDAESGETVSRQRRISNVSASPLLAGGHLYFANRDGELKVMKCNKDFEVVSEIDMGSGVFATPTVVGNDLIVRTANEIIRIAK